VTARVYPAVEQDLSDVQFVIDEVGRFMGMDFAAWVSHIELCWWIQEEGEPLTDASLEAFYMRELRQAPSAPLKPS
jgi:hypothetical protein